MDLGAFANIENLKELSEANGIEVPRLRGLRLMSDEEPISPEEIAKIKSYTAVYELTQLLTACPRWHTGAWVHSFDPDTDKARNHYLSKDDNDRENGIRWNRLHGKHRKLLKYAIKKRNKRVDKQYSVWNKYIGRDDVLYIHARIGGPNWKSYGGDEIAKQPWFLEKVDDYFDSTYCDIYAKIKK